MDFKKYKTNIQHFALLCAFPWRLCGLIVSSFNKFYRIRRTIATNTQKRQKGTNCFLYVKSIDESEEKLILRVGTNFIQFLDFVDIKLFGLSTQFF